MAGGVGPRVDFATAGTPARFPKVCEWLGQFKETIENCDRTPFSSYRPPWTAHGRRSDGGERCISESLVRDISAPTRTLFTAVYQEEL